MKTEIYSSLTAPVLVPHQYHMSSRVNSPLPPFRRTPESAGNAFGVDPGLRRGDV
ncbi:MAG: hypothetical protein KA099_09205 [Alphaproteobacteria bacterium]|nr:hypothetical protein [Alphaproteobacteria bacterium]MBP7762278.1 hypothetical protein [Alphaproteobacteria bacterium]MBP7905489.1 hypothetical protein [Alphaproteobacteria bacterium]